MPRSPLLRTIAAAGAAVLAAAALAGCVGRPGGLQAPDSWTVMKFEIADTALEPFLMADVEEMGQVGTRPGLNLISLIDRAEGYTDTPVLGIPDWVGAKVVEIGVGMAEVTADLGEVNTGDPDVLAEFIRDSIRAYPAANYALIISDHGASWPGIGGDESAGGDVLTLDELQQAIRDGLAGTGVDKLDLLGLDAGLMASFEVASMMAPVAELLLASQELEPGHGWNYTALEAAYRGASPEELGSALVAGFRSQALSEGSANEITLALLDLTRMPEVDVALRAFAAALTDRVADIAPTVGRARAETLGFGTHPDPRYDAHLVDLATLAAEIAIDALDVAAEADALVRAIDDAVLDRIDGPATRGATGLSIYFPPEEAFSDQQSAAVAAGSGWPDFLAAYYETGNEIPADRRPVFITADAHVEFSGGGLAVSGVFGGAAETDIARATIRYGVVNPDSSISLIGDEPARVSSDGTRTAIGTYDLTSLTMSDGDDTSAAYRSYSLDGAASTATIDVPLRYSPPAGSSASVAADALLSLGLDPATDTIVSEIYYAYTPQVGTYGELFVEPAGVIQPLLLNLHPDGTSEWVPASDIGLFADLKKLNHTLEPLPSGARLYIELRVVDFGGNWASVNAIVTIP